MNTSNKIFGFLDPLFPIMPQWWAGAGWIRLGCRGLGRAFWRRMRQRFGPLWGLWGSKRPLGIPLPAPFDWASHSISGRCSISFDPTRHSISRFQTRGGHDQPAQGNADLRKFQGFSSILSLTMQGDSDIHHGHDQGYGWGREQVDDGLFHTRDTWHTGDTAVFGILKYSHGSQCSLSMQKQWRQSWRA